MQIWIGNPANGRQLQRILVLLTVLLFGCTLANDEGQRTFVTEYGLGPDKWATAWLLVRHVDPDADLKLVPAGQDLPTGTEFDVHGAQISRTRERSAFEAAIEQYGLTDPTVDRLAAVIYDIEVNYWGGGRSALAPRVERAFRSLQKRHGRDNVSARCYLKFFDRVERLLEISSEIPQEEGLLSLGIQCNDRKVPENGYPIVAEIAIDQVIAEMRRGDQVVFVDVREPGEFREAHIPGALNIPLRDLDESWMEHLRGADRVVSYCVKDFRGFEMAKALGESGVQNSSILNPYGIKGWIAKGLPVVGSEGMSGSAGREAMHDCLSDSRACSSASPL